MFKQFGSCTVAALIALGTVPGYTQDAEDETVIEAGDGPAEGGADTTPPPPGTGMTAAPRIDEIRVTAQRREEGLQDVPMAVAAFSGDALKERNITDAHGLQLVTPALVYRSGVGHAMPYIRGIGSDATIPTVDPSIATFFDGVYNPSAVSNMRHLTDVERIEILKGPQGTLFGRNTTGGAISIVTREPSDEFEVKGSITYGSFDQLGVDGFVTGPITDWAGISVSAYYDRSSEYYDNVLPGGPKPGDTREYGGRVKLLLQPWSTLKLRLHAFHNDHKGTDTSLVQNFRTSLLTASMGGMPHLEPWEAENNQAAVTEFTFTGFDAKLSYEWEGYEVWVQSAHFDTDLFLNMDLDGSNADLARGAVEGFVNTITSHEIQISSPADGWYDWIGGAYYAETEAGWDPLIVGLGPGATLNTVLGGVLDLLPLDILPLPVDLTDPVAVAARGVNTGEAFAAFGQVNVHPFDWLTLGAGLRYSKESREVKKSEAYVNVGGLLNGDGFQILNTQGQNSEWTDLSPKFVATFKPEDHLLFYASWSQGFKSGTWNPIVVFVAPSEVDPEKITAYEVGFKTDFFGGLMRLNGAAFYYDYEDLQVMVVSVVNAGAAVVENAGQATMKGAELEFIAAPFEWVRLNVGGSFLSGKYDEYVGTGYDPTTGLPFEGDFSGNEMISAPKWTLTSELVFTYDIWGGPIEIAGNFYYNSGFWFEAQNTFKQPAYHVFGARLSYTHEKSNVRFSLVGSNLNDAEYLNYSVSLDFGVIGKYAPPRRLTARIDWTF